MPLENYLKKHTSDRDTVLTIGVFDGVHLGHQFLIDQVKKQAAARGSISGVMTFERHPDEVVSKAQSLPLLTDIVEKERILRNLGVDLVATVPFTKEVAGLSARRFVSLLAKYLRMKGLVVGPDFALGRSREGDISTLRTLGQEIGFTVDVVPPMVLDGVIVSSTAVRQALADGDVRKFRRLVGRFFSIAGEVAHGAERGSKLSFPTANLIIDPQRAMPANGVYATWAYLGRSRLSSATNVGVRPTFDNGERLAEVYILDYNGGSLYGKQLKIELVERLREEKRFSSIEELKTQLSQDVAETKVVLEAEARKR